MNRKFACLLTVLAVLLSSLTLPACAGTQAVYELEGMSIGIPAGLTVFTRDTSPDDPGLTSLGLTYENVLSKMAEDCTCLDAMSQDMDFEVTVSVEPRLDINMLLVRNLISENMISSVPEPLDYNQIRDDVLLESAAFTASMLSGTTTMTYDTYEIYRHPQAKFVKTAFRQPEALSCKYFLDYSTVYNDRYISITMQSSEPATPAQEALLKGIVDSVVLDASSTAGSTTPEMMTYLLAKPGLRIGLPSNLIVFNQDTAMDDPGLALFAYDWKDYMAEMKSKSHYLEALSVSGSFEISITVFPQSFMDYAQCDDDLLMSIAKGRTSNNTVYESYALYKHPQTKFIRMQTGIYDNSNYSLLVYDTVYGGNLFLFALKSNDGKVTSSQTALMQEVIDSIRFF